MKLADAEWLFLEFESDQPSANGGTHIGMFLGWAIRRGLANAELGELRSALEAGEITGRDVLFDRCDGKLLTADLGELGAAFASAYYPQRYMDDYCQAVQLVEPSADELGAVPNSVRNQALVDEFLDVAFMAWKDAAGLPTRAQLHARALAVLAPTIEAAGFARCEHSQWSADAETSDFMRNGDGYSQVVRVQTFEETAPVGRQLGLKFDLHVFLKELGEVIYVEGRVDLPHFTSAASPAAQIPLAVQAAGWPGPLVHDRRWRGFGVQRAAMVEPLLQWLSARLADFLLPTLRSIDSPMHLARAFGTSPLSRSPLFTDYRDFAVPLVFEVARHPRLSAVLSEIEHNLAGFPDAGDQFRSAMEALIARIRARAAASR